MGGQGGGRHLAHQSFDLVDQLETLFFVGHSLTVLLLQQPSALGSLRTTPPPPPRSENASDHYPKPVWECWQSSDAHLLRHLLQHLCPLGLPALPLPLDLDEQHLRSRRTGARQRGQSGAGLRRRGGGRTWRCWTSVASSASSSAMSRADMYK